LRFYTELRSESVGAPVGTSLQSAQDSQRLVEKGIRVQPVRVELPIRIAKKTSRNHYSFTRASLARAEQQQFRGTADPVRCGAIPIVEEPHPLHPNSLQVFAGERPTSELRIPSVKFATWKMAAG
jgi:hypothetical protein